MRYEKEDNINNSGSLYAADNGWNQFVCRWQFRGTAAGTDGTGNRGENIPGQDPLNPEIPGGDPESPGEDPENPEIPGGEQPDPQPPGGEQEQEEYTIYFNLAGGTTPEGETSASLQVKKGEIPDAAAVAVPQKKVIYFRDGWTMRENIIILTSQSQRISLSLPHGCQLYTGYSLI